MCTVKPLPRFHYSVLQTGEPTWGWAEAPPRGCLPGGEAVKALLPTVTRPGHSSGAEERGFSRGTFLGGKAETTWKGMGYRWDFVV